MAAVVAALACRRSPRAAQGVESEPPAVVAPPRPSPPWPAVVEGAAPRGYRWETIHHHTVHARLLVPVGVTPALTTDANGYPAVHIAVAGDRVTCQFDSGVGPLGTTLAKTPPTVYGMVPEASDLGVDHLAVRYRDSRGDLRITGYAPGVQCSYQAFQAIPDATRDAIFTVCASLRSPAPGRWRAATAAQRANGGMTDVPEGAWVEGELPATPGSLLRPGTFIASMHLGELVVRSAICPASFEELRAVSAPELEARLERRATPTGDVWIRRATDEYDGNRYPGATMIVAPRGGRCCIANFIPWTRPVEDAKIEYAVALCNTFSSPDP